MIPGLNLSNTFTNTSLGLKNSIDYIFAGDPNNIFVGVLSTLDSFSGGGIIWAQTTLVQLETIYDNPSSQSSGLREHSSLVLKPITHLTPLALLLTPT
jgi:hypothetical protein